MKFKVKAKDYQLIVKVRAWFGESLDEEELNRFSRVMLHGFLKPRQISKRSVELTGPIGISLYERLKQPITIRDMLSILEQIVLADYKLRTYSFSTSNILMDIHNTFINEMTKEVQFIYLPGYGSKESFSMEGFLNSIIYSAQPASPKDTALISEVAYAIHAMPKLDLKKLEQYIMKVDEPLIKRLKKQNVGQSDFITDKVQDYYDHYGSDTADEAATALLDRTEDDYDDDSTGLMIEESSDSNSFSIGYDTGAAGQNDSEEATGLLCDDDADEGTGLLCDNNEEEETGLLCEDGPYEEPAEIPCHEPYPYLIRMRTDESVSINKPVFRLGKERSYVDYFVSDNVAVSRSHADIITRSGRYFVVDQNSKNHTYINNRELPVKSEVEIRDGDQLKLGNEEFVFHI